MEVVVHLSNCNRSFGTVRIHVAHMWLVLQCAHLSHNVFTKFIFSHYHEIWINMIQIKSIAMLMIAIAIVGAIGKAGLLVQHANANQCGTGGATCSSNGQGADVYKGFVCSIGGPPFTTESHKNFPASGVSGGAGHLNCHA